MNIPLNNLAYEIWSAGVDAVRAERLVADNVRLQSACELSICDKTYSLDGVERICVVGAGKAAGYLATAFENVLSPVADQIRVYGHVNVPANCVTSTKWIKLHAGRPAGVNEPRPEGVEGARKILADVSKLNENDLCICLLTGGGSALLPLPTEGVLLEDKLLVTRTMSSRGASIQQLNHVRIALSDIKGGGLARACAAGRLVTLVVSDVIGDPLHLIASGPTIVSSNQDAGDSLPASELLSQFAKRDEIPDRVWKVLERPSDGTSPPTKALLETHLLANNATAVAAAKRHAEELGYQVDIIPPEAERTTAEEVGTQLMERFANTNDGARRCVIWGGEPIVHLTGEGTGRGGRNQQLVMQAIAAWGHLPSQVASRLCVLSGGTDGEDGPTDAAGAFANQAVVALATEQQLDVQDYLSRCDAYPCLDALGALIRTGPTHTNVCDLRVATLD